MVLRCTHVHIALLGKTVSQIGFVLTGWFWVCQTSGCSELLYSFSYAFSRHRELRFNSEQSSCLFNFLPRFTEQIQNFQNSVFREM